MRRDDSVTVTRTSRVTVTCDNARRSRVSHATTTTPHPTVSSVTSVGGCWATQVQIATAVTREAAAIGIGANR